MDRSVFPEAPPPNWKTTRFANFGKWEIRKGHDILVEAFNKAFTQDDDVELIMGNHNPFLTPHQTNEWLNFYLKSPLGSKVRIVKQRENQLGVYNTMAEVDCGVFPARAEGWNLELLEMLSCGKHIIATNCTGHTEYCSQQNVMFVEVDEMELAYDDKFFNGQGHWYQLGKNQIDQIVDFMRQVHYKKQNGDLGVNQAGIETANNYTWEKSARIMHELVSSITAQRLMTPNSTRNS